MFKCAECGSMFEETVSKLFTDLETGYQMNVNLCPCCQSEDIENAFPCAECGEYFTEDELTEGLCAKCETEIQSDFKDFLKGLTTAKYNYLKESGYWEDI